MAQPVTAIETGRFRPTSAAAFFGIRIWTMRLTFERRSSYDDLRAEASRERARDLARRALALGARDPAQGSVFRQHELVAPRRRRGEDVPAPPSALDAVAQQHVAERPADLVPHRAAKTAPGAHGLTLAC